MAQDTYRYLRRRKIVFPTPPPAKSPKKWRCKIRLLRGQIMVAAGMYLNYSVTVFVSPERHFPLTDNLAYIT